MRAIPGTVFSPYLNPAIPNPLICQLPYTSSPRNRA
jgi:hypothetical protein